MVIQSGAVASLCITYYNDITMLRFNIGREIKRKSIHLFSSVIPVGYYFVPPEKCLKVKLFLSVCSLIVLLIELLRFQNRTAKTIFLTIGRSLIRYHEISAITGATYLLISATLTILLFDKEIAVAALSFLTIGDTIAALIGKNYGKIKIFDKSLEGSLSFFITCLIIILVIPDFPISAGIIGAVVAVIIELLPIPLDDNLRIPISSGLVMQWLQ